MHTSKKTNFCAEIEKNFHENLDFFQKIIPEWFGHKTIESICFGKYFIKKKNTAPTDF